MSEDKPGLLIRNLAVQALRKILHDRVAFDDAIETLPQLPELQSRDRRFLMALVFTTLRRKGEADAIVGAFLSKSLPRKSGIANLILALGVAQLLFLDQPAHAVIDLSVRLAKDDSGARHFAGLINAVLRQVAEKGKALAAEFDRPRLNTPDWLWTRWSKAYGAETTAAIAAQHMTEPALDLTVPKDAAIWAERLSGEVLPTGSVRLGKTQGQVENLLGYREGAWWVQDAASAIPARLLGPLAGKTALDLCAAPGGKTLQLCAAGGVVTAVDISSKRLERLHANLKRMNYAAAVIAADALAFQSPERFDVVLLDAPCSATGTIRRHPDLPHIRRASDFPVSVELQQRLLAQAAKLVKPQGLLVYSTCSLEPEEGGRQIELFLASHPQFSLIPISPGEGGIEPHMVKPEGFLRTLPHMAIGGSSGIDGFFAARLRRSF